MLQILLYKCVRGLLDPRWDLGCPETSVVTNLRFVTSKNNGYLSSLCFGMCYFIPAHRKYVLVCRGSAITWVRHQVPENIETCFAHLCSGSFGCSSYCFGYVSCRHGWRLRILRVCACACVCVRACAVQQTWVVISLSRETAISTVASAIRLVLQMETESTQNCRNIPNSILPLVLYCGVTFFQINNKIYFEQVKNGVRSAAYLN